MIPFLCFRASGLQGKWYLAAPIADQGPQEDAERAATRTPATISAATLSIPAFLVCGLPRNKALGW